MALTGNAWYKTAAMLYRTARFLVAASCLLAFGLEPAKASTQSPAIPLELEELANEPITSGNQVEVMINGTEFYPRRLELIESAEHSIDLFMFLWCTDESGFRVAEALAAASRRGVRVRVAVDFFNHKESREVYSLLEQAGVDLIIYNPPRLGWRVNMRMHEKLMLVDRGLALLGGANLCDEYMLEHASRGLWQDYEVLVRGPATGRIQALFDETWTSIIATTERFRDRYAAVTGGSPHRRRNPLRRYEPPAAVEESGDAAVLVHYQQPYEASDESDRSIRLYSKLIDSAESRLVLHTPYMSPPSSFKEALIRTADRGVEVFIITNSPVSNDLGHVFSLASRSRYRPLMEVGIRVFESPIRTVHGKALLIDDALAAVGSHNFTHRSFFQNSEIKIITDDALLVDRLSGVFNANMGSFREILFEELDDKEPRGPLWMLGRFAGYIY